MTIEPPPVTDLVSAHTTLDHLMAQVGVDGLIAAMRSPGLLALVDQHAAAIRASLAMAGCPADAVSLARYARMVQVTAERHGYPSWDVEHLDWREADWYVVRLVAVCWLADTEDCL